MQKNLKIILRKVYKYFAASSFRYSLSFTTIQKFFSYSHAENILKKTVEYAQHNKLDGDYLEFGVYEGKTFIAAFHLSTKRDLNKMKFYAFDSFEGLPEPKGIDINGFQHFKKSQYKCSIQKFKKNLSRSKVDMNKVEIIPGWFNKTLTKETRDKLTLKKAAIVWIDCDLYNSTVKVLEFIRNYLQNGTILIFDDWFCFRGDPNRGQQRAFREWLAKNKSIQVSEFLRYDWGGNSFIVTKRHHPKILQRGLD